MEETLSGCHIPAFRLIFTLGSQLKVQNPGKWTRVAGGWGSGIVMQLDHIEVGKERSSGIGKTNRPNDPPNRVSATRP